MVFCRLVRVTALLHIFSSPFWHILPGGRKEVLVYWLVYIRCVYDPVAKEGVLYKSGTQSL